MKDLAPRNRRETVIYLGSIAASLVLSISSAFVAHEVYDHDSDRHEHDVSITDN